MLAAAGAAAYGGALADALTRAPSPVAAFVPGAVAGAISLFVALVFHGRGLGAALFLAGGTYVAAVAAAGNAVDASAPLVAVLLLLSGELSAWSIDEGLEIRVEPRVVWRRGAAVTALGLAGLAAAVLVVALSAVPSSHGLVLTVLGAAAAVGAAGTGIWVTRR
ncbi:MAG TPA: hypothetical protein VHQ99_06635 [Gaiellaceae bacterium]|nr:hypothetical protein [Gaiellaceae bacterium]